MINVLFCGYRSWALDVYHTLSNEMIDLNIPITFTLVASRDIFNSILDSDPEYKRYDIYLFVGWSWFVPVSLVSQKCCLCIHPSPLPKYRGGSPIQNQVLNGEMASSITLFKMNDKLDAGPIFKQESIFLGGSIQEIFAKIRNASILLLRDFFVRYSWAPESIVWIPQDESKATIFKRRKPADSEIISSDFDNYTAYQLCDKIKVLQDPYPNAFIKCKDNTILLLKDAKASG